MTTIFSSLVSIFEDISNVDLFDIFYRIREVPVRSGLGNHGSFTEPGFHATPALIDYIDAGQRPYHQQRDREKRDYPGQVARAAWHFGNFTLTGSTEQSAELVSQVSEQLVEIGRTIVITLSPWVFILTRLIPGHS
jgi:hypothetical protein